MLTNLKLSLTQWLLLSLSTAVGVLVVSLKLQGSRLHKAQIDALAAGIKYNNAAQDDNIAKLQSKLEQQIQDYENAT